MPDPTSRHPVSDGRMTVLRMWRDYVAAEWFFNSLVEGVQAAKLRGARATAVTINGGGPLFRLATDSDACNSVFSEVVEAVAPPTIAEIEAAVRRVIDERLSNCTRHIGGGIQLDPNGPRSGRSVVR